MSKEAPKLLGNFENHPPLEIPTDAGGEKTITIFDLISELESIRGADFPRTIIIAIVTGHTGSKNDPQEEHVLEGLNEINQQFISDQILSIGDSYYDALSIAYYDPSRISKEGWYTGNSPYCTLYPAPGFVEGAFDANNSSGGYSRRELIAYFLKNNYADRVIILPRIRYMGGLLDSEMFSLFSLLIPENDNDPDNPGLLEDTKGILPGTSIFDLPELEDQTLREVGIPVFSLKNSEVTAIK